MAVYVIAQPGSTMVKIGQAANVRTRLQSLATASPVPLELRAHWRGDRTEELSLHRAFAELHSHGEWFEFGPDRDPIAEITDHLRYAPEPAAIGPIRQKRLAGIESTRPPTSGSRPQRPLKHRPPRDGWSVRFTRRHGLPQEYRYVEHRYAAQPLLELGDYLVPVEWVWVYGSGGPGCWHAVPAGLYRAAVLELPAGAPVARELI